MNKAFFAAAVAVAAALVGCSSDTTDSTESSSNDIVTGDPRDEKSAPDTTPKADDSGKDVPLLDGPGADGTVSTKKITGALPNVQIKQQLEFPKPPVEIH